LSFKSLALKVGQQGKASAVGGGAFFLPVSLLQVPACSEGVRRAKQLAVFASLRDCIVLVQACSLKLSCA